MSEHLYKELIEELHQAQKEGDEKKEDELLFKIGVVYYEKGDYKRSKALFKDLLSKHPRLKEANYYLALNALGEHQNSSALTYLDKELKIVKNAEYARKLKDKLVVHTNFPIITLTLFVLNTIVFLFTFPQITFSYLTKFAAVSSSMTVWQLITSLFFHSNLLHYAINIFLLLMFGLYLEKHIGSLRFLAIYLISGIGGSAIQALANIDAFVIGASTAIFGIMGAIVMREPLLEMWLFGILKTPMIVFFGFFFVIENIFQFTLQSDLIYFGNIAHISGFLIGILVTGIFYQDTIETFYNWLFISVGFLIISYALSPLAQFASITFQDIIFALVMIVFASLLILYSYINLKHMLLVEEVQA